MMMMFKFEIIGNKESDVDKIIVELNEFFKNNTVYKYLESMQNDINNKNAWNGYFVYLTDTDIEDGVNKIISKYDNLKCVKKEFTPFNMNMTSFVKFCDLAFDLTYEIKNNDKLKQYVNKLYGTKH